MIITRTPYRISFFGGGTDYPAWYTKHGGAVLSATINKYCYICLRKMPPFLGSKYRIFWSVMEAVERREDILHPGVRGCLEYLGIDDGIEVNHAGDLPARSGLGSSSAFTVGMLHALRVLDGDAGDWYQLALDAIAVEQKVLKETVGVQDQIACARGGFNEITISRDGAFVIDQYLFNNDLEQRLLLVYTGIQRHASAIAEAQMERMEVNTPDLRTIAALVPVAVGALNAGKYDEFGKLLHMGWMLKRGLSDNITSPEIDAIYDKARDAGAVGGKVLGAGGGGFMLFYVPIDRRGDVEGALSPLLTIPVKFENCGSQIVLNES